jgi:PAS domain S-box-containing protein
MRPAQQLKASLKEIDDLKAALDEHAIVAVTDPRGKINYVNEKFCAISKYSRQELLGQDHRLINSGWHSRDFMRDLWATIARGKVWKGEIKNKAKDGSFYWVDTTIVPFLDEEGKPCKYVAIRADITERKKAEAAAAHLAAIVECSDDAIVGKDLRGTVTSWNTGAEKVFGYAAAEMVGQSITRLIPSERLEEEQRILSQIERGENVRHFETVRVRKDGRPIEVSVMVSAIRDQTGRIVGASKVARDITEYRAAMAEVAKLNAELEKRVAERTAELEAFSYSVSHDLRAPVRAIAGFARMVQADFAERLPLEARQKLFRIHENALKLGQLIDGLLAFSRLGRQALNKRTLCPGALVNGVLEELQSEQRDRNVTISVGQLPDCEADPLLLQQVFTNLISNALKYTRQRNPAVIEIGARRQDGACVYFVKDNGAGFDMEYAHKLFGVFQRLHREDEFEGTGVGLAIVQRIVNRHGGRVWAEGRPENGATFYFTLQDPL